MTSRELALWALLALVVVALIGFARGEPRFSNDSYQYLSVAENLEADLQPRTDIIHFDTERESNELPAPLTTFPLGFPVAIALLAVLGLSSETAALVVSGAAFVALVPVLGGAARTLGVSTSGIRFALAALLTSGAAYRFATAALTESLFTLLITGGLLCYICALAVDAPSSAHRAALLGGAVLGLSYWVRYAGLLVIAGVAVLLLGRWLRRRDRQSLGFLLTLALPVGMVAVGMVRNIVLTDTWRGGNDKVVRNDLLETVRTLVVGALDALGGGEVDGVTDLAAKAILAAAVAAAVVAAALVVRRSPSALRAAERTALVGIFVVAGVYGLGVLYLGLTTVITVGPRMVYPVLPLLFLAAGIVFSVVTRSAAPEAPWRWGIAPATAALAVVYLATNALTVLAEDPVPPHEQVERRLASARGWIDEHVPTDAVVLAADGQATSYVIERRTVSLIGEHFSTRVWDEATLLETADAYDARFLILYPDADAAAQQTSEFVTRVLRGETPSWLSLEVSTGEVRVYRIGSL